MRKNLLVVFVALAALAMGQSSDSGISFRGTFSGSVAATDRLQIQTPDASRITAGYRALLNPSIKLGQHWFGYASVQVLGKPYFFYDTYRSPRAYSTEVLQAFGGYQFRADRATVVIKAGQLTSAFGSFPLHYDDLENPVMSQPLSYLQRLTMRLDQLPCGTADLVSQPYGAVKLKCGGTVGGARGMGVATLYALPGVEADVSFGRWDARVQMPAVRHQTRMGFAILALIVYSGWPGAATRFIRDFALVVRHPAVLTWAVVRLPTCQLAKPFATIPIRVWASISSGRAVVSALRAKCSALSSAHPILCNRPTGCLRMAKQK